MARDPCRRTSQCQLASEAIKIGSRVLLMSPHPGQVKAELDGLAAGAPAEDVAALEKRIHGMLFADAIEQEEAPHG